MANNPTPVTSRQAAFQKILHENPGNDCAQQRARLLAALQCGGSFNTNEARTLLAVYYAPARIAELRALGFSIVTFWQKITLETGQTHRVGRYALLSPIGGQP